MKIKQFLAVTSVILVTMGLVGCGGGDKGGTEGGSGDIHVASWNNAADNLVEIADLFNKENEGTDKGQVIIDYADSDYTKLKPALAAGDGVPDIFQTQNRDIQAFYNNYGLKGFVDISDIIVDDADNWVPAALQNCLAEDGKYYAIPWDIGPVALYYRTDIFEEAGIDPTTLTTWDKYIDAGKVLKEKGYYVEAFNFNASNTVDQILMFLNQLGGQFYDSEGNVDFSTPEMHKAVELGNKMIEEGVAMDIPTGWDDRITAINDNKLVALSFPAWFMGTMKNSCADTAGKWAAIPMPAYEEGGNNTANAGGSILAVSSTSKNVPLAKEFLEYAMKSNEGNDINTKYGEFPSYTPAYETDYFNSTDDYYGGQEINKLFSSLTNSPPTDFGPYFVDVHEALQNAIGNILVNNMDYKQALEQGEKEAQNAISAK